MKTNINYNELCKISSSSTPETLLRTMAKSNPALISYPNPGIIICHIDEFQNKIFNTRRRQIRSAFKSNPTSHPILEEPIEISTIKENYYDDNDPDIIRLREYTNYYRERKRTNTQKDIGAEDEIDNYIKDTNEEDEELYKGFKKTETNNNNVRKIIKRTIQSAHPHGMLNNVQENNPSRMPFNSNQRPTTVPLAVVQEKQARSANKKKFRVKSMKFDKSTKGGGFTIPGKFSQFTTRFLDGFKRCKDKSLPSCMIIKSQLPYTIPNSPNNFGTVQNNLINGMYKTMGRTKSSSSDENLVRRSIRQVNLLTDSLRPTTAAEKVEKFEFQGKIPQERPMTAYISIDKLPKENTRYIATTYIKPYSARNRPISAAINYQANAERNTLQNINPEKIRTKYIRYLKELEAEAKNFIIAENDTPQNQEQAIVQRNELKTKKKKLRVKKKNLKLKIQL